LTYYQLTENERYQISSPLKEGFHQKHIAQNLRRSPLTISSELTRNRGLRGYRPKQFQTLSDTRRVEADKAIKLTGEVIDWIEKLIRQELSPQQVADK
jgi:IS30 family transposase